MSLLENTSYEHGRLEPQSMVEAPRMRESMPAPFTFTAVCGDRRPTAIPGCSWVPMKIRIR